VFILKNILKIFILAFVGIQIVLYFIQERLIFYPQKLDDSYVFKFKHPFTEFSIPRDGAVLNALYFKVENPKGIIVHFHGNAGNLKDWGLTADALAGFGYDVIAYDYRGFGKSTGKIRSEKELVDDARAVLDVARKDFPESKIILFGRSLGTGLAVQLAAESKPKLLMLETPYRSMRDMAHLKFPLVLPFVLKYPLRSDLFAKNVTAPVEIFHGTDDELVPFSAGEALSRDFSTPVRFHRFVGGHHGDLSQFADYRAIIGEILAK
jgi:alpha-beta hydrolase superfamily lysophospholipase